MLLSLLVAASLLEVAPLPPHQYRVDETVAAIMFTTPDKVDVGCGNKDPKHWQIFACSQIEGSRVLMPHPCLYTDDNYARLLCHELGHISGWPADHPDPQQN